MPDEFDSGFTDASAEFRRMRSEVKSGFDDVCQEFVNVRSEMKSGIADVRQELVNVRTEMKAGFDELRQEIGTGLGEARQQFTSGLDDLRRESRAGLDDLRRHMLVLHEETLERIGTLAFDPAPLGREFQAGDAAVREDINARLEPIEAAIRTQARRKKLKPRR